MSRPIPILLLAVLWLVGAPAGAEDETLLWETYLNLNDVRDLDHDGTRLWIATGGGVVSYEPASGETRAYHRAKDRLLSDSLSGVAHAPDGRVWFGTEMVGISVLDPQTDLWEPFTSLLRPIPGDRIQRLRIANDTLFVGTAEGVAVFVGGDQAIVCLEGIDLCGLPSFDVRDLASAPDGDGIWVATAEGVAHRDSTGIWTTFASGSGTPPVHRLVRHGGRWVAAFDDGLFSLDPELEVWTSLGGPTGAGAVIDLLAEGDRLFAAGGAGIWSREGEGGWVQLGDRTVPASSLVRAPDGTLWAGARDANEQLDGIWFLSGDSWHQVKFDGPSLRAHYLALAFDSEGVLHLSHAESGTVPMVQSFDGTSWTAPFNVADWTFDLLFSPSDELLLAQCCCKESGCNLRRLVGGVSEDLPPRNLRDIVYDADGNLWCASDHAADNEEYAQGIWFLNATTGLWDSITVETPGVELLRNRVRAILPLGRDVWIGYSDRGVHRWDIGPDRIPRTDDDLGWVLYSTEEAQGRQLISDEVTGLAAAGERIWVGTTAGLSLIDASGVTNIGSGFFGLPSPIVNDLIPLGDGGAWVATRNAGLTRMIPDGSGFLFETYGPPDLPHPNVEALTLDPDGRTVWLGTNRGLARLTLLGGGFSGEERLIAYPNPFLARCGDGVRLDGFSGEAEGAVVDLSGRIVRRFERARAGDLVWDGRDGSGQAVAPGLYWIRVASPEGTRAVGVGLADGPCPSYMR